MNYRAMERNYICFRTTYYNVPLEKISDDFPAEKIGTFERVCMECGPEELDEQDLIRCLEGTHIMMTISEFNSDAAWIRRHKRTCYFCMKSLYRDRPLRNCEDCRKDLRVIYQDDIVLNILKNDL